MSRRLKHDLAGKRFGRLTVVAPAGHHHNQPLWRVLCDCGKAKVMATQNVLRATSCGCVRVSKVWRDELAETKARLQWAERLLEAVCSSPLLPPAVRGQVARAMDMKR